MKTYSPLFKTIYDKQEPSSDLRRSTHYSILRAIVGYDEYGDELMESWFKRYLTKRKKEL